MAKSPKKKPSPTTESSNPAGANTPAEVKGAEKIIQTQTTGEVDKFEKLKKRFLASNAIAVLLLIILIITNLKELGEAKDFFFPYKKMIVTSNPKHFETGIYKNIALKLNIAVNSEKSFLFNDAIASLSFFEKKDNKYIATKPDESFFGEYNKLLQPFDNAANKADIFFNLRCIKVGTYLIVAKVHSKEAALQSRDSFFVKVNEYDLEDLNPAGNRIPVFILKDSIVDTSPKFISELEGMKIILWQEAEETDITKSTVRISPDYIGAEGGLCYSVYKDPTTIVNFNLQKNNPYYKKSKQPGENEGLEQIGVISLVTENETLVPIGNNFYSIRILDGHRLFFKKVFLKPDTLLSGSWIESFDKPIKNWELPDYKIKFKTEFSTGASGRNLVYSLAFQDKTYENIDRMEVAPGPSVNAFPLFIHINYSLDNKEFLKFVYTDSDSLFVYRFKDVN